MSTFHPFPDLPLELREHIWELSMVARTVAISKVDTSLKYPNLACYQPPTLVSPTVLHACVESRRYLQLYYSKAFFTGTKYYWINFEIDAIQLDKTDIKKFPGEHALIRHLVIESRIAYPGFYFAWTTEPSDAYLRRMKALERLIVLDLDAYGDKWWFVWDTMMTKLYYRDDPAPFHLTVLGPSHWSICEINSDTYFSMEREWRKKEVAENRAKHPEWYVDDESVVSDSDDDVDSPHRYRIWNHADGCNCPRWHPSS